MADILNSYSSASTLTVTGLTSLANNTSATSATVNNTTTKYLDVLLEVVVTTAASAIATGYVDLSIKGSIDGTDFDDDVNDKWVGSVAMSGAGAQTRKRIVSVASAFGGTMPAYWQLRVRNACGDALASGSAVSYIGVIAQSI